MFGFGKKVDHRAEAIREFMETCAKIRTASEVAQIALGHAINMANSMFHKRFGTVDTFSRLPRKEKLAYVDALASAVQQFKAKGDAPSSMGFDLFKSWVAGVALDDEEMASMFAKELAYFSKKGEPPISF